jgi:four helix bundle protein
VMLVCGMAGFEELLVWQDARSLATEVYQLSGQGLFGRDRALKDQVRRASVSIASNIAEGHQRKYRRDFARFLTIALGSVGELRTQLYIAGDLGYLTAEVQGSILEKTKQLSAMIDRLRVIVLRQVEGGGT